VFAGADRGIQKEIEHDYERSLPIADAMRDEVLLAYGMNGARSRPSTGSRSAWWSPVHSIGCMSGPMSGASLTGVAFDIAMSRARSASAASQRGHPQ
jgi:hypothetical protein